MQKSFYETTTQKIKILTYNKCNSLTYKYKIILDKLTCH